MWKYSLNNLKKIYIFFSLLMLSLIVALPQLQVYLPTVIIYLIVIMTLFISDIKKDKKNLEWFYIILASCFSLYTSGIANFFGYKDLSNRYISLMPMVFIYIVYGLVNDIKVVSLVWKIMVVFSTITMFKTSYALIQSPYISRMIKSSGEFSENILKQGIGDYAFIYGLVIMEILFFSHVYEKKGKEKLIYILLSTLGEITIILSNYMTALILSIIGIGILTFFKVKRKHKILFLFLLIVGIFMILFWKPMLEFFLSIILDFIPDGKNYDRLLQLKMSVYGNGKNLFAEFMGDRIPVLSISYNSILKYPWGGVIFGHLTKSNGYYNEFGHHSFVFDTIAIYGLLLGIVLIFLLCFPFFSNMRLHGRKKELTIAMFVVVILLLMFNNATFSLAFLIYVMYPYVCDKLYEDEQYV